MAGLIEELESFLGVSFLEFNRNREKTRAAERNFQLLVEQASDINAHIAAERSINTPENYWESFRAMERLEILDGKTARELMRSAKLRNILIHEYDFGQDNFILYKSVKKFIPIYKNYIKEIERYYEKQTKKLKVVK
jgi:uncharacterized protein YutE (UPF0331/DUF86 family)